MRSQKGLGCLQQRDCEEGAESCQNFCFSKDQDTGPIPGKREDRSREGVLRSEERAEGRGAVSRLRARPAEGRVVGERPESETITYSVYHNYHKEPIKEKLSSIRYSNISRQ